MFLKIEGQKKEVYVFKILLLPSANQEHVHRNLWLCICLKLSCNHPWVCLASAASSLSHLLSSGVLWSFGSQFHWDSAGKQK